MKNKITGISDLKENTMYVINDPGETIYIYVVKITKTHIHSHWCWGMKEMIAELEKPDHEVGHMPYVEDYIHFCKDLNKPGFDNMKEDIGANSPLFKVLHTGLHK